MDISIKVGGVKITPQFFESHVKLTSHGGLPTDLEKKEISLRFGIPVLFEHCNGSIISRWWYFEGLNQSVLGEPAYEQKGKSGFTKRYLNKAGWPDRVDGPAVIQKSHDIYIEEWLQDNKTMRKDGPATIRINYPTPPSSLRGGTMNGDPLTHFMTWEQLLKFFDAGYEEVFLAGSERHKQSEERPWFPPLLNSSSRTLYPKDFVFSVVVRKNSSWLEGEPFRKEGLPDGEIELISAERAYNVGTNIFRKVFTRMLVCSWRDVTRHGVLHRTEGPSTVCLYNVRRLYNGTDLVDIKAQDWDWAWHLNGKEIPKLKIINWAKKNRVPLRHGPLYGKESIFYKPEDEVCFMADFS